MLVQCEHGQTGPAAESLQVIVRIPIIITVACRDYTVSPAKQHLICARVASSKCQQTVNTDQDKGLTPYAPPTPTLKKVPVLPW